MHKLGDLIHYKTMNQLDKAIKKLPNSSILSVTQTVVDYENSIYNELENVDAIHRLNKINQLGLAKECNYSICSSGTRLVHSLICASEIDRLAQEKGLKDRKLGIIAGMSHDIATPPFSDSVAIGLDMNDEELFEYVLDSSPDLNNVLKKYSVQKKELVDVVTGESKSIMSRLINSKDSLDVDRWSYTIYDAWNLGLLPKPKKPRRMPYVPDPFKHVTIDDNNLIFNNMKSLSDTLELRVNMFTDIYNNPELLAREAFLENISKDMIEKEIITKESLFKMGDEDFMRLVWKHGGKIGSYLFRLFKFESYGTVDADEKPVRDFLTPNVSTPFIVKRQKRFNTAADSLVMVDDEIDTYRNWRPRHTRSMEDRMSSLKKTFVYGLVDDYELSKEVKKAQEVFGVG